MLDRCLAHWTSMSGYPAPLRVLSEKNYVSDYYTSAKLIVTIFSITVVKIELFWIQHFDEITYSVSSIDTLHKWHPNLNNDTLYILSLMWMFVDKFLRECEA